MYFSAETNGFYDESLKDLYGTNWPKDTIKISKELYESLLEGQSEGRLISSDKKGNPILTE